MNYAIITENDESKWDDETGVLYHFPARYKNILTEGTSVIYYKGQMKDKKYLNKRLSAKPHYFGIAKIGEVYPDSKNKNEYFAKIEEYIPFVQPLDFKDKNNEYIEIVTKSNYWRDGVRKITVDTYKKIIKLANFEIDYKNENNLEAVLSDESLPNLDDVSPVPSNSLFTGKTNKHSKENNGSNNNRKQTKGDGFSRNAKKIGDRAEQVVLKFLKNHNYKNIRWVANEGEKPGYDISCVDHTGLEIYIEVKGTSTSKFNDFIITNNELSTAEKLGDSFYIYFVTNCLSKTPKVQSFQNPYKKIASSKWELTPLSYKVFTS
ncbi:DUF3883 domain-containing protein [Bacillus sp. AFS088145]|uniref:protein NO VEIN domain-containing protein n=1 Tax=Bacillus sp. AFS088145 TaxID=2033514 RepID=UPI000BF7E618|nr:DUF3883 domain-containing protein [Bacillus sp. AFS088145]PFH86460.1 hypothetical protein COI44_12635 [Bacillus sp. AFS088145]